MANARSAYVTTRSALVQDHCWSGFATDEGAADLHRSSSIARSTSSCQLILLHLPSVSLTANEVRARAPELATLHLQRAIAERGELGENVCRQDAARARGRVEDRVRRSDVEHGGLGERGGTASQGDSQNLEAVAKLVVVRDERTDAGKRLVGGASDGRDAERGGDRRDRVHDRAGDVGAV